MPAPTVKPEWATDETNIVEPDASQKESGWQPDQDAIQMYQNWHMWLVWKWVEWFSTNGGDTYGSRSFAIGPDRYRVRASTFNDGTDRGADWSWMRLGAGENAQASIDVPAGDTLESVTWEFRMLATGVTAVKVALRRCAHAFGAVYEDVASYTGAVTETPAFSTYGKHTLAVNHKVAPGFTYQLYVETTAGSPQLAATIVTHKREPV